MEYIDAQCQNALLQGEGDSSPIHGDLLEVVLSHVPLVDLVHASCVSKSWEDAVSSSLLNLNKAKPWLLIHNQCRRSFLMKKTFAYDPRSDTWVEIKYPFSAATKHTSFIGSSNSNFLYQISPNRISFSDDPLHLAWTNIPAPSVCRVDPIVALVGSHLVVAGGVPWFEDDLLSVEMYDMEASNWSTCQSMPDILKDSAAPTWLSVASNQDLMYVIEKASGILYSFNPKTKAWSGPYDLRPDPGVFFSTVAFAGADLILAGIFGDPNQVLTLKIWKVKPESMDFDEIGEIPLELLEKLKGGYSDLSSVSLMAAEDFIYLCNSSDPSDIIFYESVDGNWRWGSVKNLALNHDRIIGERMVMSYGKIGIDDLQLPVRSGNLKVL